MDQTRPRPGSLAVAILSDLNAGRSVSGVKFVLNSLSCKMASKAFSSAVFRVMPHGNDPERFKGINKEIQSAKLVTLSEYRGQGKADQ